MIDVLAVVAVMPAASSSVIFAKEFGGAEDYAGASIVITTLLSLATIPLLLYFLFP
jgi:predicted permease